MDTVNKLTAVLVLVLVAVVTVVGWLLHLAFLGLLLACTDGPPNAATTGLWIAAAVVVAAPVTALVRAYRD